MTGPVYTRPTRVVVARRPPRRIEPHAHPSFRIVPEPEERPLTGRELLIVALVTLAAVLTVSWLLGAWDVPPPIVPAPLPSLPACCV